MKQVLSKSKWLFFESEDRVMYESPINIFETPMQITTEINAQTDEMIYKAVKNVGVDVNKEELVRALQYDREQYYKGYHDGEENAMNDFADWLIDQFTLLFTREDLKKAYYEYKMKEYD